MGGKYQTSHTIAQLVIIMYRYCIIEYLLLFQKASPNRGSYLMATGYMILPTSKLPFLNCITDVLLMQVPSGNMRIGGLFGFETCSFNLQKNVVRMFTFYGSKTMRKKADFISIFLSILKSER